MMFYDEFPLLPWSLPGIGGGIFNGAQELVFGKSALEQGLPTMLSNGQPNPAVTVAIENMGHIRTPDGTCARDNVLQHGRHHLLGGGNPGTAARGAVRQQPWRHRVHAGLAGLLRLRPAGDLR